MTLLSDFYKEYEPEPEDGIKPRMSNNFEAVFHTKGKAGEFNALQYVKLWIDKDAYRTEGKDYDIVCPNLNFTYEVKTQKDAHKFVVIEISRRSSPHDNYYPSGISTTKALAWIIYCKNKYFVIPTSKLKSLIEYQDVRPGSLDGDSAKTKVKLVSIDSLNREAIAIWE